MVKDVDCNDTVQSISVMTVSIFCKTHIPLKLAGIISRHIFLT